MEELLPGLVRVMEERLGKFGRPLTTVLVICLALGASAWGIRLFWDNLASPFSKFIQTIINMRPISLELFVEKVITPTAVFLLLLSVLWVIGFIIFRKTIWKPSVEQVNKTREITQKMIQEAKNAIDEMREAGVQAENQIQIAKQIYQDAKAVLKESEEIRGETKQIISEQSNPDIPNSQTE